MKILIKSLPFLTFILFSSLIFAQPHLYYVTDYAAIGDSININTRSIQKAIDVCSANGGGKVHFKKGKWLSGTLILKDNVTLSLNQDAQLLGNPNINDYSIIEPFTNGVNRKMGYCFIGAVGAKNIGIEGKGIIDGQGKWVNKSGGGDRRPFLLRLVRCEKVNIKGVQLINSTAWTFHLFQSKEVNIKNIKINSMGLSNNDGIDIDGSQNVTIKDCDIVSGDDAICFKSTSAMGCKNILVKDVTISTKCGAIKIGTESIGDFENIKITNCHIIYANIGGIKLFSVDGAHLQNIEINNIKMDNVTTPIMLRLGARQKTFINGDTKRETGTLTNVHIKNIEVANALSLGFIISGIPGHNIDGITIKDVNIHLQGSDSPEEVKLPIEEKITSYPDPAMFGKLPAYGMFIRHATNIIIKNVKMTTPNPEKLTAIYAQDIQKITLKNWQIPYFNNNLPLINLDSSKNVTITDFKQTSGQSNTFLSINNKESTNIKIDKNTLGLVIK